MEGDFVDVTFDRVGDHFYPRPPGGGRPRQQKNRKKNSKFLSTPSGWRATKCRPKTGSSLKYFYPRPPGGGRLWQDPVTHKLTNFYPRPPGGGRRGHGFHVYYLLEISIHALRVEGDDGRRGIPYAAGNFYPRPPGGGRQQHFFLLVRLVDFYPRPPGGGRPTMRR